ncbi:sodium-dependent transporter, partial [Aeromonas caviae]|uniref:sodium-dependent transporter n=1 Tax=Aeromonas caviae TaxID=648 RepID=UPI0025B72C6A
VRASGWRGVVVDAFPQLVGATGCWLCDMGALYGFLIYGFYSVVGGWTVGYAALAVGGELNLSEASTLTALFTGYVSDPLWPALTHLVFAGLTWWFVQGGLQQGVERALRWMMPALFVMMLLLVVTGLSMPGAMAGVRQFLMPDFSHLTGQGVLDALGLAFFSLSIGLGVHTTYGAYLPSSDGALRSGVWVVTLASCISVLAGLMIFPVLASTGIDPAAGPGLTFMTMPAVFNHLPFGQGLAVIFFLLLLVAALSSSISMLEHLVRFTTEEWGWSRRNACRVLTLLIMACGIPVSLSFGPWADYTLFGKTLFDLLDYLTSNLMMPLFGLVLTLLLGWKLGDSIVPADLSPLMRGALLWCWRLVAPLLIAGILVRGLL